MHSLILHANSTCFYCKNIMYDLQESQDEAYHAKVLENKKSAEERTSKKRAKR